MYCNKTNLFNNYTYPTNLYISGIVEKYNLHRLNGYFNKWNTYLSNAQSLIPNEETKMNQLFIDYELNGQWFEIFDFGFQNRIVNMTFKFNLNIEMIKDSIKKREHSKEKNVRVNTILKSTAFNYYKYDNYDSKSSIVLMPIAILYVDQRYCVVDGNHKLSFYYSRKIKKAPVVFLTKISSNYFCYTFDWLMYMFQSDLTKIVNNSKISSSKLLLNQPSFISELRNIQHSSLSLLST